MTVHTGPVPARTDASTSRRPLLPRSASRVRLLGALLAVRAGAWGVGFIAVGADGVVSMLTALAFQIGLLGLPHVQRVTGAVGTGRIARARAPRRSAPSRCAVFVVEHVLVAGAIVNSSRTTAASSSRSATSAGRFP
jgi:hypothetical protein